MSKSCGRAIALSWLLIIFSVPSFASSFIDEEVGTVAQKSRYVYRVLIQEKSVVEHSNFVFTAIRMDVKEVFKGNPIEEVTVHIPGGQASKDMKVQISGVPEYREGSEYIIFTDISLENSDLNILTNWAMHLVSENQYGERYIVTTEETESLGKSHAENERGHHHALSAVADVTGYDDFVGKILEGLD